MEPKNAYIVLENGTLDGPSKVYLAADFRALAAEVAAELNRQYALERVAKLEAELGETKELLSAQTGFYLESAARVAELEGLLREYQVAIDKAIKNRSPHISEAVNTLAFIHNDIDTALAVPQEDKSNG